MNPLRLIAATALALAPLVLLGGCAVASTPYGTEVLPPMGVTYVAPTYPMPAAGYAWRFNVNYGWGWYHPYYGWHRGWY